MLGLLIRTSLLLVIVFAVVYAATRALRRNAHSREAGRIRQEIAKLRAGIEAGLFTQAEYTRLVGQLEADCEREGIAIPKLPARIEREPKTESAVSPSAADTETGRQQE